MKNIINKISQAVQVVLLAPIKLPGKVHNILKYVAVGLGVIESVLDNGDQEAKIRDQKNKDQRSKLHAEGTGEDDEQAEGDIGERKEVSDEATE